VSDQDRQALTQFFERLQAASEPPDPGAYALIVDLLERQPQLRYTLTQLAFFQEHALAAAQSRIQELEWQLSHKQGGFLGLFSGASTPAPAPIQAPGAAPGLFRPSQGGFLGSAGGVAVGVLGGALLGGAIASALTAEPAAAAPAAEQSSVYDDDDDDDDWGGI